MRLIEPEAAAGGRGLAWRRNVYNDRLTPQEIDAWARHSGVSLEPWHCAAIALIDELYLKHEPGSASAKRNAIAMAPATDTHMKNMFSLFGAKRR